MDWPLKKRLFYAGLHQTWQADQQQATQHADELTRTGGVGDLDALQREAQQVQQPTGGGGGNGRGRSGQPTPTPSHLPDDLDPTQVPTPDGVTNPYAQAQAQSQQQQTGGGGAAVDGQRITRRESAARDDGAVAGTEQLYDPREIHPAVRKHGSVVQVRGDPDDANAAATADTDAPVNADADAPAERDAE